jgi:hypothetical protein
MMRIFDTSGIETMERLAEAPNDRRQLRAAGADTSTLVPVGELEEEEAEEE